MNYFMSRLGDGVTQTWTLTATLATLLSVKVNGVTAGFTQPNWDKVRLSVIPSVGSTVSFEFQEDAPSVPGSAVATPVDLAPILAAIAAIPVPVASSGGGAVSGEVREFAFGAIPVGYTQVDGEPDYATRHGSYTYSDIRGVNESTSPAIFSAYSALALDGGLIVMAQGYFLFLYTSGFVQLGQAEILGAGNGGGQFCGITGNRVFKFGGSTASTQAQVFSSEARYWTTIAPKPTAVTTGIFCEAKDKCIYGQAIGSIAAVSSYVSKFDITNNVWIDNFDTAPLTGVGSITLVPSGKLLFCYATAQYLFNPLAPAGQRWTSAGTEQGIAFATAVPSAAGVIIYSSGITKVSTIAQLVTASYIEASNSWVYAAANSRIFNGGKVLVLQGINGNRLYQANSYGMLTHNINYSPRLVVRAQKV